MTLVGLLLFVESRLTIKGDRQIIINDDVEKGIVSPGNTTLLASLLDNQILIPCACGGKGTCGTCKCVVEKGGGDILPTELSLVSRRERKRKIRLACQVKVKQDMEIRIPEEIFNVQKYVATVVSNENVATFIKELVLRLDSDQSIEFKSGAYIQIDIPEYHASFSDFQVATRYVDTWKQFNMLQLEAGTKEPSNRAYSLASAPAEKDLLKFTIRIATPPRDKPDAPPGIGSSYVFNLKPGAKVTLSGPYGEFFIKDTTREMCFIGGGAGMAPMRSHIRHQLLTEKTDRRLTFWYGARSKQEMFYHEEFTELAREYANFSYFVALSDPQPEDHWEGLTGFIHQAAHDHYLSTHEDPTEIEYYLCGPPLMMQAVFHTLDDLGVDQEMIAFDDFG
jgi:Na+-transporting NADH:ubiquinone oxidoreductase subunit F